MKRGKEMTFYILSLIICIVSTTNLVRLLVPSQNNHFIIAILLFIVFVAIFLSLAMIFNGFRPGIKLIVEHKRNWKIAFYILDLIICIESITYLVLLLISSQNNRLIVAILFSLAITIYGILHMIKFITEPAGEEQNEQEQTF